MLLNLSLMIIGFICLWKGGDFLVDGATDIAKAFQISPFIIGLTLVALGTSAPELAVNIIASLNKQPDITFGNIIGSNLSNLLLVLGLTAIIHPIQITDRHIKEQLPISIAAIGAMVLVLFIPTPDAPILTFFDGLILLSLLIITMIFSLKKEPHSLELNDHSEKSHTKPSWKSYAYVLAGLVLLPLGGKWVTEPAIAIAAFFNISTIYVSLFTIAIGTSLPELATSVNAALKEETDMAMGNIIGSNIFNVFLILGVSACITTIPFNTSLIAELVIITLSSFLIIAMVHQTQRPYTLNRFHGVILLMIYVAYATYATYRG